MGRYSTGISTINGSRKLDLRWMLKNKYFIKNKKISGLLEWEDGGMAEFESLVTNDECYLRLIYAIVDNNGNRFDYDYVIELVSVTSNLGKGDVLYFLCPESFERARVLYMAYGVHKYIHRNCYLSNYGVRLYYDSQARSKEDYHNTMYFNYRNKVKALEESLIGVKHRKTHYRGKPIKEMVKLEKLRAKMKYHNSKRIEMLGKRIQVYRE